MDPSFRKSMQQLADSQAECPKSSVLSQEKFEAITLHLLHPQDKVDPHFKHWVKKRQFQLADLPGLGLFQVLVLPKNEKSKVRNCAYSIVMSTVNVH